MNIYKWRKIFYTPGIISFIYLPFVLILCTLFQQEPRPRTMDFIMIAPLFKAHPEWLMDAGGHFPPQRNYVDIVLTGNQAYNRIRLDFAQLSVREIMARNDTVRGVHFKFTADATYGDFVWVLNILAIERAQWYVVLNEDIYFMEEPEEPVTRKMDERLFNDVVTAPIGVIRSSPSWWTVTLHWIAESEEGGWGIVVILITFLTVTLILRVKTNNNMT
ncbi:hypothetical protein F0L74_21185 [Chitinophaga agrisoli]|uniref:Uncharacterized protein n=1 Tax=Chitinophaga agrisoli TaxID=2607653 RepID=A0A5B2VGN7_9BACT|nr:hypothetical protein [Chitinophaga agrisoli]KAA2238733.1 hypothetical protein F0L74_21185 [Chitinophaga agrisoli]